MILRTFGWSFGVTAAVLAGSFWYGGWTALVLCAILGILEISLSFDNAVINASVLERMSHWWRTLFLTVGIAIAVFGMRLVFPLALVSATSDLGPIEAFNLARTDKDAYQTAVEAAHPAIAAFGGMFLLMIFLDFIFEEREVQWLVPIEKVLAKVGALEKLSIVIALGGLAAAANWLAPDPYVVLIAGVLGILTYLVVNGLGEFFEGRGEDDEEHERGGIHGTADMHLVKGGPNAVTLAVGKAAFFLFLYLEVLDASFSFDGVVGAFAVSQDIFIIAAGLGIGAMYIRSLTVFLVKKGTLREYVYLEHGAHWAIGALAVILLVTIKFHVNEIITGLIGVAFIGLALWSSIARNKRNGGDDEAAEVSEAATEQPAKA